MKSVNRKDIPTGVLRKLYAESMGRCMNPSCQFNLFIDVDHDISEKAHIVEYCKTEDNSFENLVILCPNCHTLYDKAHKYTDDEVRSWKKDRVNLYKSIFEKKYNTFDELKAKVVPILEMNKIIFENYYLGNNKDLWDDSQDIIISNNLKLKDIFNSNFHLFQKNPNGEYSNLNVIYKFIAHVDEFEKTREKSEKHRSILFPNEMESIFGITPVKGNLFSSVETIEKLISSLKNEDKYNNINLGLESSYIELKNNDKIFLNDEPRLRQLFYNYGIKLQKDGVRLNSYNFTLKYLVDRNIKFNFPNIDSLKTIKVFNEEFMFVYEYCLSKEFLERISPRPNISIVNLYSSWNGNMCISKEARSLADDLEIRLLTQKEFFEHVKSCKYNK